MEPDVERLMKQLGMGGGGGDGGTAATTTLTPVAGFCVKTFKTAAAAYEPSGKVFVNICSHESVERAQGAAGLAATDDHLDHRGVSNLQVCGVVNHAAMLVPRVPCMSCERVRQQGAEPGSTGSWWARSEMGASVGLWLWYLWKRRCTTVAVSQPQVHTEVAPLKTNRWEEPVPVSPRALRDAQRNVRNHEPSVRRKAHGPTTSGGLLRGALGWH
jgi:hypothetical protein